MIKLCDKQHTNLYKSCMLILCNQILFFFSSRRRHTRCSRDWSSDVCSSDLRAAGQPACLDPPDTRSCTDPPRRPGNSRQLRLGIRRYPLLTRPPAAIYSWGSQRKQSAGRRIPGLVPTGLTTRVGDKYGWPLEPTVAETSGRRPRSIVERGDKYG